MFRDTRRVLTDPNDSSWTFLAFWIELQVRIFQTAYSPKMKVVRGPKIVNIDERTNSFWVQNQQLRLLKICELWSIQNVSCVMIGRWNFVRRILGFWKSHILQKFSLFQALFCPKWANMLKISQNSRFSKPPRLCIRTVNFQILRGIHLGYFKVHKSPMISTGGSEAQKN